MNHTLTIAEFAVGIVLSIVGVFAYDMNAIVSCIVATIGIGFLMNSITVLVDGR